MKTALLIIDIQNDYFPNGKNELVGSLEASQQARRLLECFRQNKPQKEDNVIFIQHISTRPGATFFLPGTTGAVIYADLQPLEGETIIQKHYPNSFRETPLLERLHQEAVSRLIICGMMTHMCVDATTRAAFDYGFDCIIAGDACATKDLVFQGQKVPAEYVHFAFLAALNGTYGNVLKADEIISQL